MNKTRTDREFYKGIYESGDGPWSDLSELDRRTKRWLNQISGSVPKPRRMLDLGTGMGRIVRMFDSEGYRALGIDYLLDPILRGSDGSGATGGDYVVADAFDLPFGAQKFSVLVDYGLLHHVRKSGWPDYRSSILRRLKPGGYFFVSVFHVSDEHSNRETRKWVYHRGHYDRFFALDDLNKCLGDGLDHQESQLVQDEEHTFLHALYRRSHKGGT